LDETTQEFIASVVQRVLDEHKQTDCGCSFCVSDPTERKERDYDHEYVRTMRKVTDNVVMKVLTIGLMGILAIAAMFIAKGLGLIKIGN